MRAVFPPWPRKGMTEPAISPILALVEVGGFPKYIRGLAAKPGTADPAFDRTTIWHSRRLPLPDTRSGRCRRSLATSRVLRLRSWRCRLNWRVAKRQDWSRPLGPGTYDVIHAFTKSRAELAGGLKKLRRALNSDGMIWISWPKKAAGVPTDVTEDVVRAEALKLDLVDVKVAAVDNTWSGLKLVVRVSQR
jgi:hypothetical protein